MVSNERLWKNSGSDVKSGVRKLPRKKVSFFIHNHHRMNIVTKQVALHYQMS